MAPRITKVFIVWQGEEGDGAYATETLHSVRADRGEAERIAAELWLGRVSEEEIK